MDIDLEVLDQELRQYFLLHRKKLKRILSIDKENF
jgi:hypothetical protein